VASLHKPSVVFVHGIWADGSSFRKLIPPLQAEGYEVLASQHGLDTLDDDIESVRCTIARANGPVLLVGHSYGGTLITHAGIDPRVAGLVYIAALSLDSGETSQGIQAKFPTADIYSHIEVRFGRAWMKTDGIACFAGDLPDYEQRLLWATQNPCAADLLAEVARGIAWKSKPSWYIVCTDDRTLPPELQRFMANRMGSTIFETASSHVPMLSQPEFVLDVIRNAGEVIMDAAEATLIREIDACLQPDPIRRSTK
jgi:pimeloyl-ACP methyl ester carboxylesterase